MRKSKDEIVEFDAARVRPLPDQPRKRFKGIKELAASIAEVGQMSPGLVTMIEGVGPFDAQLIDGERRLRACRQASLPFKAIVKKSGSEDDAFVASFAANFGKQDHDVIEISDGLARMQKSGKTVEQMARICGRSECWVYQHLNLQRLHPEVREMMVSENDDEPTLTSQLAQLLIPLEPEEQLRQARKVTSGDGMRVAEARRMILKVRSKSEDSAYAGAGRKRSILTIESLLEMIGDKIGVYLDMPGSEFNQIVDRIDHFAKRDLIKSIDKTAEDLTSLAEAIEGRLPKLAKRSA